MATSYIGRSHMGVEVSNEREISPTFRGIDLVQFGGNKFFKEGRNVIPVTSHVSVLWRYNVHIRCYKNSLRSYDVCICIETWVKMLRGCKDFRNLMKHPWF